jgi:hypothetical protein
MFLLGFLFAHESQYFADPFDAPAWRAPWAETSRSLR